MNYYFTFDYDDFFGVPTIEIGIDDIVYFNGEVKNKIEINSTLEPGDHELWIRHYGKKETDQNSEHDRYVELKELKFENVNLDQFEWIRLTHYGKFYPEYNLNYLQDCKKNGIELLEYISPNHYFGHNGIWKFKFQAPELSWIIRTQNPSGLHLEGTIFSSNKNVISEIKDFFGLN